MHHVEGRRKECISAASGTWGKGVEAGRGGAEAGARGG